MKLLFVCRWIDPNLPLGVSKTAYYLFKELYKNLEVNRVFLPKATGFFLKDTIKMFLILKKTKANFDILYLHHNDDIIPAIPLLLIRPSIVCIHDIIPLFSKERKMLYKLYFKFSLLILRFLMKWRKIIIIVPSFSTKKDLIAFGFPKNRIIIVRWGIDHSLYVPIDKIQKEKEKRKEIIIGFLGVWTKKESRKKVDLLIEAVFELRKKHRNLKLILAGKYPSWLIEKYKNDIEFLGILPEEKVPEFYNEIDIFVYPSEYEGFGLQVLEAMACETLVLASDIPVFREILPKELLFKLDKESLIAKVEEFLDKEKIKKYSEVLYKKSLKYDWKKVAKKIVRVLRYLWK